MTANRSAKTEPTKNPGRRLFACPGCGSFDVEVTAWIRLNSCELVESAASPSSDVYCPSCGDEYDQRDLCCVDENTGKCFQHKRGDDCCSAR